MVIVEVHVCVLCRTPSRLFTGLQCRKHYWCLETRKGLWCVTGSAEETLAASFLNRGPSSVSPALHTPRTTSPSGKTSSRGVFESKSWASVAHLSSPAGTRMEWSHWSTSARKEKWSIACEVTRRRSMLSPGVPSPRRTRCMLDRRTALVSDLHKALINGRFEVFPVSFSHVVLLCRHVQQASTSRAGWIPGFRQSRSDR